METKKYFGIIILFPLLLAATSSDDLTWNEKKYLAANTAVNENYLTKDEKLVYYYLNLARTYPSKFADTYLKDFNGKPPKSGNEKTLWDDMKNMKPVNLLKPDQQLFYTAECWANESGKSGVIGHDRKKCKADYWAECCAYGNSEPLAIVLQLLIDNGVPSLGHRKACLGSYSTVGIAIRPHKNWGTDAVFDFK